ncbi:MAG: hypothetical protein EOO65_00575 [Methanosarcinales archaeon]|nr:MAG: hypothetical protein EOO65_00575 [Methanosarcinales archaeon]
MRYCKRFVFSIFSVCLFLMLRQTQHVYTIFSSPKAKKNHGKKGSTLAIAADEAHNHASRTKLEAQGLQPGEEYLLDTAFVTMAAGDTNGRLAVALVQSLRNSGRRV